MSFFPQRVYTVLARLFPDEVDSLRLMDTVGLDPGRIQYESNPLSRWFEIVREANRARKLDALIVAALVEYHEDDELIDLAALRKTQREIAEGTGSVDMPLLIVAIGSDAALGIDLAALRAVRTDSGMEFARIQNATLAKLKTALDRERRYGRTANVHLAVHSSPNGIELGGQVIDAEALSEILDGVQVLVIAGCEADQVADFLGVVPYVVSMSEVVSHTDAALFTQAFWTEIGQGVEPGSALQNALSRSPSGMREYVVRNFRHSTAPNVPSAPG